MKRLFIVSLSLMVFTCLFFLNVAVADDLIYGCKHKQNGKLRIVQNSGECNNSENLISWNKQGSQGEQGIPGEQGPQGLPGSNSFIVEYFELHGDPDTSKTIELTPTPSICALTRVHIIEESIQEPGNYILGGGSSCDVYEQFDRWWMDSHSGPVVGEANVSRVANCAAVCLVWE